MPAESRAVLFKFDLLGATGHLDFRAIVQIAGLGALEPDILAAFFSHNNLIEEQSVGGNQKTAGSMQKKRGTRILSAYCLLATDYSLTPGS
jgi:hypothetical protein